MSEKMTTSEPYTGECKDCYQHVLSPECDGHGIRVGEPCPYGKPMEKQTTNEPTTKEIVATLRRGCLIVQRQAADRLESQENELSGITGELEQFRAFHERYAEQTSKKYTDDICALTARAEQAERERDAAVNALTLYEDALFDECDKSYQSGFMDGFQSREEIDDED